MQKEIMGNIQKTITFFSKLRIEKVRSHWKSIGERSPYIHSTT
jgi:hypothetical protein